jgi:putative permease
MFKLFSGWLNRYFSDPQVIILGGLLVFGFLMIWFFGALLTPVFAALIIAYLLDGIVMLLRRFRIPRILAVLIVFLLFMAFLVVVIIGLIPSLSSQIGQLLQQLPTMISRGQKELMLLPQRYPDYISEENVRQVIAYLSNELTTLVKNLVGYSLASFRGIITMLVYLVLVPLLVFFFLKDKQLFFNWIEKFLPEERGMAMEVWNEVYLQFGNYVRGKIWEIFIVWGVTFATFRFLNLDFSMLLSLFVGLSVLVPYIGATVMFLPVAFVAYTQWGVTSDFFYVMLALFIIQILDGNLLVPLLLSGVVNLHPVAIISAVLVFGGLWGIWGLFFAIPLATLVHAVIKAWMNKLAEIRKRTREQSAGPPDATCAPPAGEAETPPDDQTEIIAGG